MQLNKLADEMFQSSFLAMLAMCWQCAFRRRSACCNRSDLTVLAVSMSQSTATSSLSRSTTNGWAVSSDKETGDVQEDNNNDDNNKNNDDELPVIDLELGMTAGQCSDLCAANGNSKLLLSLVCLGIKAKHSDRTLGDVDSEPHKSIKPRNKVVHSNKDMTEEVVRGDKIEDIREKGKLPMSKNWSSCWKCSWCSWCSTRSRCAPVGSLKCSLSQQHGRL